MTWYIIVSKIDRFTSQFLEFERPTLSFNAFDRGIPGTSPSPSATRVPSVQSSWRKWFYFLDVSGGICPEG